MVNCRKLILVSGNVVILHFLLDRVSLETFVLVGFGGLIILMIQGGICDCTWEKVPFRAYNDFAV